MLVAAGVAVVPVLFDDDTSVMPLRAEFAQARESGQRVELMADRTEFDTVWANPDGSITRRVDAVPSRVQVGGAWKNIDYTLKRIDGGSVAPVAAPGEVRLSGGGDDKLLVTEFEGVRVATRWPSTLPEPELDGPSALYRDVFDDVDLVLTASAAGVSQVLVVRTAEAAADPGLAKVRLGLAAIDGSVGESGGGLRVLDEAGREVGRAPAPTMWDSSGEDADLVATDSDATRVQGPLPGDAVRPVALEARKGAVVLAPDAEMLADSSTKFPVFVDPQIAPARHSWAMVRKESAATEYYKSTAGSHLRIGFDNLYTQRLFWKFEIDSRLYGVKVSRATFAARLEGSPSGCTATKVSLYRTAAMSSATNWSNQPSVIGSELDYRNDVVGSGCNPSGKTLEFNAQPAVQAVSNSSISTITMMLKAGSETNTDYLKQFAYNASLYVTYASTPGAATELKLADPKATCTNLTSQAQTIGGVNPRVQATLSDVDTDNVRVQFEGFTGGFDTAEKKRWSEDMTTAKGGGAYAGSGGQVFTSATRFTDNGQDLGDGYWSFRARAVKADDPTNFGPWSDQCVFRVSRAEVPAPVVSGASGQWRLDQSRQVTFSPAAAGAPVPGNVASYAWSLNSTTPQKSAPIDAQVASKQVTVDVAATRAGSNTLRVWSYDVARNRSTPTVIKFDVSADVSAFSNRYTFDEASGNALDTASGFDLNVATGTRAPRGTYRDDAGAIKDDRLLTLPGTGAPAVVADSAKVVPSQTAFTVSAWLDPNSVSTMAAVSGYTGSNWTFMLGTSTACSSGVPQCFTFSARTASTYLGNVESAVAVPEGLTHVVGTISASGKARLYVFAGGDIEQVSQTLGPVTSGTKVAVGAIAGTSSWVAQWKGGIDNVTIAPGVFDFAAVVQLHGEDDRRCFVTRSAPYTQEPAACAS